MEKSIREFNQQFSFEPVVVNADKLMDYKKFILAGMGGSHLAADVLKSVGFVPDLAIHSDYGLPIISSEETEDTLVIASSYSGNTEETIDCYMQAMGRHMPVAVIASGGKLIELAKKDGVPHIMLPNTGIQPRMALGVSALAILKLTKKEDKIMALKTLNEAITPSDFEKQAQSLALEMAGDVPLVYSSKRNYATALNWKIKFNETGKIPAFYNVLPELNHNEMTGFDVTDATRPLSKNFYLIFLRDSEDDPRILKRMDTLKDLYKDRGLPVKVLDLTGKNQLEKVFNSLLFADWTAYFSALNYEVEPEQVPMVEEFKRLIS